MESKKSRDPRKVSRGARGGRGYRPRVQTQPENYPQSSSQAGYRPRVQSQPENYPQSSSQAGYRPHFNEAPSQPLFHPNQPLPQIPTQFDPFEPRFIQQKRREPESGPLPLRDDSGDDEYYENINMVPETQPYQEEFEEEVEEVAEVPRQSGRKPATIWTPDEEEALAKSWIKISVDKVVGDRQKREGFWVRILRHFKTLMPRTERTNHMLNSKWGPMNAAIVAFNGYYQQANRIRDSGCDELQVYERADLDYEKQFRKAFAHKKAWHILKDQPKWQEQPLFTQNQESTGSSKKRKSSESSSAQTPTSEPTINVDEFDCQLPNLNDNPTPSRQRGKKKATSEDSSRSSLRDTLASYTAEKQSLLQAQLEVQKKKDDEYFSFLTGEVYNRDMKFVMEPHDNIPDPVFKEFVITKKREICAKYGWPCSL